MKRYFIYGLITSLVLAGALGITVLLSDNFDELEIRILVTTLAFAVYSIIGLCCNSIVEGKYSDFGKIGIGVTFIGLLYAIVTTWATPKSGDFLEWRFGILVIALCFAHCSLMLLVKTYNSTISAVRTISISASVIATLIALVMISNISTNLDTFKLLGIVSIVGVIATIITPILSISANKSNRRRS